MDFNYNQLSDSIANNAPGTIAAIGSLFNKPQQPIINMYQNPEQSGSGNNLMIIGAIAALVVLVLIFKNK